MSTFYAYHAINGDLSDYIDPILFGGIIGVIVIIGGVAILIDWIKSFKKGNKND